MHMNKALKLIGKVLLHALKNQSLLISQLHLEVLRSTQVWIPEVKC